ncbi:MAG: biopolymer transporter ExbD [Abditibacteriaceae bacterium]
MQLGNTESGRRRHSAPPMAEINIVPMVDIVLVLLIIFMATTSFVKQASLDMKLPAANASQVQPENDKDITVALTHDNKIFLDGKPSNVKQVQAVMLARVRQNPQTRVIVKGDDSIEYKRVVAIINLAKEAGLPQVALATELQK